MSSAVGRRGRRKSDCGWANACTDVAEEGVAIPLGVEMALSGECRGVACREAVLLLGPECERLVKRVRRTVAREGMLG
jgi:hypothetical protein